MLAVLVVVGVVTAVSTAEVGAVDCDGGYGDDTGCRGDYCHRCCAGGDYCHRCRRWSWW